MDVEPGKSLVFEKTWSAAAPQERQLEITVVYTTVALTLHALRTAGQLANQLHASITVLVPQQVPYPLPLTSPPVLVEFAERHFRTIADLSPVETRVRVYLCRDANDVLASVLRPGSLVVIGGRKRFWPTAERRLAKRLRRAGHEVIVSEKE